MQHELNHTVQELLGARGLDEVSRETLSALVREYPYSALLHLLYSKKLQLSKDPQYADSVARTALYFSNPHWLHHLLRPKTSRDAVREMEKAFAEHVQEVPSAQTDQAINEPATELPAAITGSPQVEQELPVAEMQQAIDTAVEDAALPVLPEMATQTEEELPEELAGDDGAAAVDMTREEPETVGAAEGMVTVSETEADPDTHEHPIFEAQQDKEAAVVGEHTIDAGSGTVPESLPLPEEQDLREVEAVRAETPQAVWHTPDIRPLEADAEIPEFGIPPLVTEETEISPPGVETIAPQQAPVATGLPSMPAGPVVPADTGLIPLEPYYTIDYFASQGIQLSEDEKLDPLGRKLKRFTEWLKTMKKIHPDKSRPVTGEEQSDETVRAGAEHSNDRSEVVTEAMAEVYLKQGQAGKAVEIYRKLSLLDPSRSATFAAKIAELNTPDA